MLRPFVGVCGPKLKAHPCAVLLLLQVLWSRSRAAVFYALEDAEHDGGGGRLFSWDLLLSEWIPTHTETAACVRRIALSNDFRATGCGESSGRAHLATCTVDGRLQVHQVAPAFAQGELDESYQFMNLVQSFA